MKFNLPSSLIRQYTIVTIDEAPDWTLLMGTYEKQFKIPEDVGVSSSRPDLFLYSKHLSRVIIVELNVPWATNIPRDHTFKLNKYYEITNELYRNKFIVNLYVVEVGARVNFGAITTGLSLGWPSPALVTLRNGTDIPLARPITEEEGSWVVSGGYLLGSGTNVLGGMLMDKIGRKYCILLVSLPKVFMSIWTIFVTEVWMLILCRVVMVVCDCFVLVVVPVYASEIACKEHRGSLGAFLQLFSCFGVVISLSIGPFLSYVVFNTFIAVIIAATTLPLLFLPESPFYLYSKGYKDEAIKVLSKIRDSDFIVQQEMEEYDKSKENKVDKLALIKNKLFLKSLSLGILVCTGAILTGYMAVSNYLQTILESTQTSVSPEIASVVIGCIQFLASFGTTLITNTFGRRPILIYSLIGMVFGMLGLGTFFKISETEGYIVSGFMNYLPLISMILVIFCYSIGIGTLLWLVTAELFDGPTRAIGYSISMLVATLATFLTLKYFVTMITVLGPDGTYWFFSITCLLVLILIALFLPETKGKTFNEIQDALKGKSIQFEYTKESHFGQF